MEKPQPRAMDTTDIGLKMQPVVSKIDAIIQRIGFAIIYIGPEPDVPPYAYTVGLTETYGCPELLIFGVNDRVALPVFNSVIDRIKAGERFTDGTILEEVLNFPCAIRAVGATTAGEYALNAISRYESASISPSFQQIVYPDEAGLLPWDNGYSEQMRRIQAEPWRSTH